MTSLSPKPTYRYLAVTQGTADWLQGKSALIDTLFRVLCSSESEISQLAQHEFVDGPVHMSANASLSVIALWNVDYLSGLGDERWGFVRLDEKLGLASNAAIGNTVLERCLYVINQRLQGLMLDGTLYHRTYPNGSHTCLAGRGTETRQFSVGYFEKVITTKNLESHAIIFVGPSNNFEGLAQTAENSSNFLPEFISAVSQLVSPSRNRPAASSSLFSKLRHHLASHRSAPVVNEYEQVQVSIPNAVLEKNSYGKSHLLTYSGWISHDSSLSDIQRRILSSDALEHHPLRIIGPGGSGKTLLMQLLALRRLEKSNQTGQAIRILYIVHNQAMQRKVEQRLTLLANDESNISNHVESIQVTTLLEYGRKELNLDPTTVIDPDAHTAKAFQLERVTEALQEELSQTKTIKAGTLISTVARRQEFLPVLALLIVVEISSVIKGHGLENDRRRYVQSERKLSRFHGILDPSEREFVFNVFQRYHRSVFEQFEVLDTDDVAISLLGRLRTPMWELKRKKLGFDYIFVDETQQFNENERRIFPYLTNASKPYVPIALALDQAQDVFGQASAGLATLGITNIANESLSSIHRSTRAIVKLAFFVIQRSTDLFGPDFPDFTSIADRMERDTHPLASLPEVVQLDKSSPPLAAVVMEIVANLRKSKLRQVAVLCHAEQYWIPLENALRDSDLPLHVMLERGERLPPEQPLVVLARPLQAGGQEFDAVVMVGLEQGITPPRIADNEALSSAVEQQAIREMYLGITRARYRVNIVVSTGSSLTPILRDAEKQQLLHRISYAQLDER